jgi:hypothetical protein
MKLGFMVGVEEKEEGINLYCWWNDETTCTFVLYIPLRPNLAFFLEFKIEAHI